MELRGSEPAHADETSLGAAVNRVPRCSINAGDGIGLPRCWVMNATTCPLDCRTGT